LEYYNLHFEAREHYIITSDVPVSTDIGHWKTVLSLFLEQILITNQIVDIRPLKDLKIDNNIDTLNGIFDLNKYDVMVRNGIHKSTGKPYADGIKEWLLDRDLIPECLLFGDYQI